MKLAYIIAIKVVTLHGSPLLETNYSQKEVSTIYKG